ncbi:MAG TPA: XRE family transcriptional regulator [Lachnospiraceae bacterium]|nr:XRE family transcriptional regulator [Lachnospiraceae bacterium]
MKRLSQKKMIDIVKQLRKSKDLTQEQLSVETGINRQMIGRLEKGEYMPSIPQLEKLAEVLEFDIPDLYVESDPMIYTAFRGSGITKEEKDGIEHMFDMMMASKQQLLLRKVMLHEQG